MKKITPAQSTKLHTLLSQMGLMDEKKALLLELTAGRTDSARALTMDEAAQLISQLSANDPRRRHIQLIWSLAHRVGIIWGDSTEDNAINAAKLNKFLRERGTVKKDLHSLTLDEAKKVHRQFEGMLRNNSRTADNKGAKEATKRLLSELNIITATTQTNTPK